MLYKKRVGNIFETRRVRIENKSKPFSCNFMILEIF